MRNSPEEEVTQFFQSFLFKKLNIMVKAKQEHYMGELKTKFYAVRVFPASYELENISMNNRLLMYKTKQYMDP